MGEAMTDKTPKVDALRRMREEQPAKIGAFKIDRTGPFGHPLARATAGKKQSKMKRKSKR